MPLGQAPLLGGVGRDPLDFTNELLVTLLGLRKGGFRAALRITSLFGLKHNALLYTLKPRGCLVDLRTQSRFALSVLGAQRFDLARMRGVGRPLGRIRISACGVSLGRDSLTLADGRLVLGASTCHLGARGSKPYVTIDELLAQHLQLGLQCGVGGRQ